MPRRVPGKRSWTAWASTWAVECRMTARPSALAAGTGSTWASASGAQARSLRSPVARSRTTTAPSGPFNGTPASLSASAAVVPAGTRIGASAAGGGAGGTGAPGMGRAGAGAGGRAPAGPGRGAGGGGGGAADGGAQGRGRGGPGRGGGPPKKISPRAGASPADDAVRRSGQHLDDVPGPHVPGGAHLGVDAEAV